MTSTSSCVHDGPEPGICIDAELLASYIDERVTPAERADIDAHLARCEDCQFVHRETMQALEATQFEYRASRRGRTAERRRMMMGRRVAVVLAAAAAVVVAVQVQRGEMRQRERDRLLTAALSQLDATAGAYRKYEPRLSLASAYRPLRPPIRSGSTDNSALALRSATVEMLRASGEHPLRSEERSALAAIYLTLGQLERAADVVVPAAASTSDPALLNDAAATLLVRNGEGDAKRAMELLEQALTRHSDNPEALFNVALAAESTGDVARAQAAWERYLARDRSSEWAVEAREHLDRLRSIVSAAPPPPVNPPVKNPR
ncbi:MAG: tetratricopeptide repeat protein [Vicinamibacterales bacterium]